MAEVQTNFTMGNVHFSQGHAGHKPPNPNCPLQQDLQLRTPDGSVVQTYKQPAPPGSSVQTTLNQFKY